MKVSEVRYLAARDEIQIPGIITSYKGVDVDFYKEESLVCWISSVAASNHEADTQLDLVSRAEEEFPTELAAVRRFLTGQKQEARLGMILRINREGEFIAHPDATTAQQCGKVGARRYRYFVTIEADNSALTEEGYVMENLWVEKYFRERYEERGEACTSCEDMAQRAVHHFFGLFQTAEELKDVQPKRIYVRIHGSDVSFIEAEWKNG